MATVAAEPSPFDYEGYRFANERMRALAADGDPRGEMRNVQGVIDGIIENYAEAVVHYQPAPGGTDPANTLVVNARNARILTHALRNYGARVGVAFTSVRFVFDADFPGRELRSDVWTLDRFPKLRIVVAEDGAGGDPGRGDADADAVRAAAWRNGPLALVGAPGSWVKQFRIKRCRTSAVYADLVRVVGGATAPTHETALHSLYIQRLSNSDPSAVASLVRAILSPKKNNGRPWLRLYLPLVSTLRAYPGEEAEEEEGAPTVRTRQLVLVAPPAGTSEWRLGVPGPAAWEWLSAGPGIARIHAPDLSCLGSGDWEAVTDWIRARTDHLMPPPPIERTTRLPPAPNGMLVLVHRVAPATAPHYARRSVVGQTARHLRVIVHNDGRSGHIERTIGGFLVARNPLRAGDPSATHVFGGEEETNPLWWDEIDDQAQCYKDAVNAYNIRSFGGMVVLAREHAKYGSNWLLNLFTDSLHIMWPALVPLWFARPVPDGAEQEDAYRVRFLLDASRLEASADRKDELERVDVRRVTFKRALDLFLLNYRYTDDQVGPTGTMHDAILSRWDAGDIRFVAPGERPPSAEEQNAYLGIP
jgi:hypothetical protein